MPHIEVLMDILRFEYIVIDHFSLLTEYLINKPEILLKYWHFHEDTKITNLCYK